MAFLPTTKKEIEQLGWDVPDFVLVTGDAYVDHPTFGVAIISRLLESYSYKIAILAQPDWRTDRDFTRFGQPKLGFMVTAGNIDSMVAHYTAARRKRSDDAYSPGGKAGKRPDRAVTVYTKKIKEIYPDSPVVIAGLEASLRRFAHYDYWDNKVRRSILLDSQADILMYGMGEHQIVELAEALDSGIDVHDLTFVRGTVYKSKTLENLYEDYVMLPSFKESSTDKKAYCKSFLSQYENTDAVTAKILVEPYNDCYVIQNKPSMPLSQSEFDNAYGLNYMRNYHPMYEEKGGIPAIEEVKFSIISNRGCFGSCNFCALAFHQGRVIQARSHKSIINEAKKITWEPDFKGYIHDVGGPTANFRQPACDKQLTKGACKNRQCLFPDACKNLKVDHRDYVKLLRELRELPKVKKVFVRSGIRYDYLIYDKDETFFKELCQYHVSGQLKVAPEHVAPRVLEKMGKPSRQVYDKFTKKFYDINRKIGKEQYLVPYLMSSHPGSDLDAAIELAEYLRDLGYMPEQVQDFYPTPGTLSTCMFYTGLDPRTMKEVYVPKTPHEKAMQRALIQYRNPKNYKLVEEALKKAGREDLIGFDKECLIRPYVPRVHKKDDKKPAYKGKGSNKSNPKSNGNGKSSRKGKTIRQVHKKKNK